jgi:iron complex transport system permease protein
VIGLLVLLVLSLAVGVLSGPAGLTLGDVWRAVTSGVDSPDRAIVLTLRLPRVIGAVLVGASLAVSGAIFQALLRNPLAEPYLLGVSSGAALGAVGAITLGLSWGPAGLAVAAFVGALVAIGLVFRVARVVDRLDTRVLILAGVVVAAFFGAGVMLLLTLARSETMRSALLWTMGSLSGTSWSMVAVLAACAVPASLAAVAIGRDLNALAIGEETAAHLGTTVERTKRVAYVLASLLAATAVSVAGVIGFVGLVVPHAARILWGADHRTLLPVSFVAGGALLVLADATARSVASPLELPVGVVTALLGVPFFLVLLRRNLS